MPEGPKEVPIGIDAEAVAKLSQPGDLWVRSNGFYHERREGDDGRASWPPQPSDMPSTRYRRLVGPWLPVVRPAPPAPSSDGGQEG